MGVGAIHKFLGRAGFSGQGKARDAGGGGGAHIYGPLQEAPHVRHGCLRGHPADNPARPGFFKLAVPVNFSDQPRLQQQSTVGDGAVEHGQLERRDANLLAHGNLAGGNGAPVARFAQNAGRLARQIDTG